MSGRTLLGELGRLEPKSEGIDFAELPEMQSSVCRCISFGWRLHTSLSAAVACHVDDDIFSKYRLSQGS